MSEDCSIVLKIQRWNTFNERYVWISIYTYSSLIGVWRIVLQLKQLLFNDDLCNFYLVLICLLREKVLIVDAKDKKSFFFAFKISYHIFHRSRCLNITFGYNWSLGRGNSRGSTWCTCMCQYWRLNLNDIHIRRCFWSGNFKHFYAFRWLHICHYYRFLWTDIANNRCSFGKIQKWFKSFHVICPYPFFCISCRLSRFSFVDSSVLSISISEIPPFFLFP